MILVTVGISVYNCEKYLSDSIKSVLNQTYKNLEIIILNDGSTDNSFEIINSFNDSRIFYVNDGFNKGLVFRLNQMCEIASGDFFVRMDADDIMFADRIERQLNIFKQYPQIDIVHGSAISIDDKNNILGIKIAMPIVDRKSLLKGAAPIHPTIMGRLDWFIENNYSVDYYLMEDFELWYRTVNFTNFATIKKPILFYRELSQKNSFKYLKMIPSRKKFVKKYYLHFFKSLVFVYQNYLKYFYHKVFELVNRCDIAVENRYQQIPENLNTEYFNQLKNALAND